MQFNLKQTRWLKFFGILFLIKPNSGLDYHYDESFEDDYCSMSSSTTASRRFSYSLFKTASSIVNRNSNLLISPLAVGMSLAMVTYGTLGNTRNQLISSLEQRGKGDHALDSDCILRAYYSSRYNSQFVVKSEDALSDDSNIARLRTGSRLYGDRSYTFREEFVQSTGNYGAEMDVAGFRHSPILAARKINSWVSDQTEDTIDGIFTEGLVIRTTVLVLSSTILFKGSWQTPFVNSSKQPFVFNNGRHTKMDFMVLHAPVRHQYSDRLNADMVEILYASPDGSNVDARLILILPRPNVSIHTLGDKLSDDVIIPLLELGPSDDIEVEIPKFSLHRQHKLKYMLKRMGVRDLFLKQKANLSGMVFPDPTLRRLFLNHIQHTSYFEVDEHGTHAMPQNQPQIFKDSSTAQSTGKRTLRFDRPFIFLIYEKFTDSIIFMGRVIDPRKGF